MSPFRKPYAAWRERQNEKVRKFLFYSENEEEALEFDNRSRDRLEIDAILSRSRGSRSGEEKNPIASRTSRISQARMKKFDEEAEEEQEPSSSTSRTRELTQRAADLRYEDQPSPTSATVGGSSGRTPNAKPNRGKGKSSKFPAGGAFAKRKAFQNQRSKASVEEYLLQKLGNSSASSSSDALGGGDADDVDPDGPSSGEENQQQTATRPGEIKANNPAASSSSSSSQHWTARFFASMGGGATTTTVKEEASSSARGPSSPLQRTVDLDAELSTSQVGHGKEHAAPTASGGASPSSPSSRRPRAVLDAIETDLPSPRHSVLGGARQKEEDAGEEKNDNKKNNYVLQRFRNSGQKVIDRLHDLDDDDESAPLNLLSVVRKVQRELRKGIGVRNPKLELVRQAAMAGKAAKQEVNQLVLGVQKKLDTQWAGGVAEGPKQSATFGKFSDFAELADKIKNHIAVEKAAEGDADEGMEEGEDDKSRPGSARLSHVDKKAVFGFVEKMVASRVEALEEREGAKMAFVDQETGEVTDRYKAAAWRLLRGQHKPAS
ncbi:unnamed protein product [Amoebophrya sp. A25]|nr:unnamed protein product [Amoebophrya sp. A25]|eukprot:GSA25T00008379001.1